jgi:catechol 2,3-dioxygenase-like lactoylglutathione lyase family enzyme
MTVDRDFKRVVRAKARRSGQSYASVLRRLRNEGGPPSEEKHLMNIVRTIPDIRSLDLPASRSFYEGLLGFKIVMDVDGMLMFASPTQPGQQVTVNGDATDATPLPAGFSVDVGYPQAVTELHDRARAEGFVIIESLEDKPMGIRRFSLLDPNGARVTILAHLDEAHQPPG